MKRLFTLVALCLISIVAFAQKDVTKFLGIPVDGTKTQMIQKLKAKGFVYNQQKDILKGEFNGEQVEISVQTQGNKVWRLAVSDVKGRDEGQIKIRYNKLINQFKNNENYMAISENEELSEDEDIRYKMIVDNKQYQTAFYQKPNIDSTQYRQILQTKYANEFKRIEEYKAKFSEEEFENPQGELKENMEKISEVKSEKEDSKELTKQFEFYGYAIMKDNNPVLNGYSWSKAYYLSPVPVREMELLSADENASTSVLYQNPYWPETINGTAIE